MGSSTAHGFPYPVGTDRVMDGDNAMQALAEQVDAQLYAGAAAPGSAPGLWLPATGTVVCTDASLAAQPGTSIVYAKYTKIGRTVFFQGEANTTTLVTPAACVNLPNGLAGVPRDAQLMCGQMYCFGSAPPTDQSGVATMPAAKDRIRLTAWTSGLRTLPAGHGLRWNVVYETTT